MPEPVKDESWAGIISNFFRTIQIMIKSGKLEWAFKFFALGIFGILILGGKIVVNVWYFYFVVLISLIYNTLNDHYIKKLSS